MGSWRLWLGQCNSSNKSASFCTTLVVVAVSSEALAWLTKVKCERINRFFAC